MSDALVVVFWAASGCVAWPWAGFPLVLLLRALRPKPTPKRDGPLPHVSYLIVVHNEAAIMAEKLANVEAVDYPRDRLQVIVASDGSSDATNAVVAAHAGPTPVELLPLERIGKNAALNAAAAAARGEVLALSDADSMLERDALRRLVGAFCDPSVGGVAGDFRYVAEQGEARGERSYWSLDRWWKWLESRAGSATSATGQLYAIRRSLFSPVPDGVTDDFYVSTGAIAAGRRLWFEAGAVARGRVASSADAEFRRKVRLIGRGFASVWSRRDLLDPRRSGFYAVQLFSHKVLRRLVGAPLFALAASSLLLWNLHPLYALAAGVQTAFHLLAVCGWALRNRGAGRARLLALPFAFDAACIAGLIAFGDFLRGRSARGWVPERQMSQPQARTASPEEA